jgi:hypothetical protein
MRMIGGNSVCLGDVGKGGSAPPLPLFPPTSAVEAESRMVPERPGGRRSSPVSGFSSDPPIYPAFFTSTMLRGYRGL